MSTGQQRQGDKGIEIERGACQPDNRDREIDGIEIERGACQPDNRDREIRG